MWQYRPPFTANKTPRNQSVAETERQLWSSLRTQLGRFVRGRTCFAVGLLASVGPASSIVQADPTQRLIGLTEERLLSCAGIPAGAMVSGGTTFFQYGEFSERGQIMALGDSLFVAKRQKGCQAIVSLRNGRVVNVTLKKKGLIRGPMACERIFSAC